MKIKVNMMSIIKKVISLSYKPLKLALVVRGDLKMSKGKTAAQCSHAAILCYEKSLKENSTNLRKWCNCGQPKIVLRTSSSDELQEIYQEAMKANLVAEIVRDAGRTQLAPGTATVVGIGPDYEDRIDTLVKHLKLL